MSPFADRLERACDQPAGVGVERGAEIGRAWLEHEALITNFEMAYLIVLLGIEHIGNIGSQVLA